MSKYDTIDGREDSVIIKNGSDWAIANDSVLIDEECSGNESQVSICDSEDITHAIVWIDPATKDGLVEACKDANVAVRFK
jgi:hypothetical protein